MKLSMWSAYYIDLSPEEAVLELEKNGYAFSELSDEHADVLLSRGDPRQVGAEFRAFAASHGESFLQGHLMLRAHILNDGDRNYIKAQLDMFEALGVKNAVLHVDRTRTDLSFEELREANLAAVADLAAHVSGRDTVICLENIKAPIANSAENLLWFIDRIGGENMGICLDTGHLNLTPDRDQAKFIRTAGKYLRALHLADNDGSGDQHIMPSAKGTVDFAAVFAGTRAIGYDGLYNYEISGEREVDLELRSIKLDYIRRVSEYYYSKR